MHFMRLWSNFISIRRRSRSTRSSICSKWTKTLRVQFTIVENLSFAMEAFHFSIFYSQHFVLWKLGSISTRANIVQQYYRSASYENVICCKLLSHVFLPVDLIFMTCHLQRSKVSRAHFISLMYQFFSSFVNRNFRTNSKGKHSFNV